MRSCELHALAVQDKVFMNRDGGFTDPYYAEARAKLFLVRVDCEHPAGTCFCMSMGTGPAIDMPAAITRPAPATSANTTKIPLPICSSESTEPSVLPHFDLALTELADTFTIRSGSSAGQAMIDRLDLVAANPADLDDARRRVESAAVKMGCTLDTNDVRDLLHRNQENPRWDDVADRCLSCTNCTMVCPTCFCSSVEDVTDLSGDSAERVRRWDSCFNPGFAGVHGGNFRPSVRGRFRQWLTHKFASWHDQFDVSGCVGCGRCITWCPVAIDVTVEITALRAADGQIERALL
jgi:formate hydrogenlyase subunit 6/NADH:ubiquinone oxidoreductase subunit I